MQSYKITLIIHLKSDSWKIHLSNPFRNFTRRSSLCTSPLVQIELLKSLLDKEYYYLNTIYEKENHTNVTANYYNLIYNDAVCLFG